MKPREALLQEQAELEKEMAVVCAELNARLCRQKDRRTDAQIRNDNERLRMILGLKRKFLELLQDATKTEATT